MTVGKRNRCRSIPGLLQRAVILVKRSLIFRHRAVILPRFRDHHHHHFLQSTSAVVQHFQSVVEAAGIRCVRFNNRKQLLQVVAPEFAFHDALSSVHPVAVAVDGVDLSVVGHKPQRLSSVPAGERVGRKTAVHHGQVAGVVFRLQVFKEGHHLKRR